MNMMGASVGSSYKLKCCNIFYLSVYSEEMDTCLLKELEVIAYCLDPTSSSIYYLAYSGNVTWVLLLTETRQKVKEV